MAFKAFISEDYIKANSYIAKNVDVTLLRPVIRLTQEKYILPLLGTALYQYYITNIVNNTVPAGVYKTLLDDYIDPCLLWYIVGEITLPLTYRFNNKALLKKSGDDETPVEKEEVFAIMEYAQMNAEHYASKLIGYLCANSTLYTEYTSPGTTHDTVHPLKQPFTSPIFVSGRRGQGSALSRGGYSIPWFSDDIMQWIK